MIRVLPLLFLLILGCGTQLPDNSITEQSIEILLVKALDMRCTYRYEFKKNELSIKCINEAGDTCNHEIATLNQSYYLTIFKELKGMEKEMFEFEEIDDGEFLKIAINWNDDRVQTLTIKNFPDTSSNVLKNISPMLNEFYLQLDSYRCW